MDILKEYALLIQVLFSAALVAATFALTWVTCRLAKSSGESSEATKLLAKESRMSREDANRPVVVVRLKPSSDHGDFIRLVVSNVGRGPALDLAIRVECNEEDFSAHEVTAFRGTSAPIGFMAHGDVDTYSFGTKQALFRDPPLQPFWVALNYKDLAGETFQNRVEIDVAQFRGLAWTGASVTWRQMRAFEKIEAHLKRIVGSADVADIVARYALAKWRVEHRRSGTIEDIPEKYRNWMHQNDKTEC